MDIISRPARDRWEELTVRNIPADDADVTAAVEAIVNDVCRRGDKALREYTLRFDGVCPDDFEISEEEIADAIARIDPEVARAIDMAAVNIRRFHAAQLHEPVEVETLPGVVCSQRQVPLQRVGLYIPGGRAPLFSTVLMLAIPARVAGCAEVVMCTPRGVSGIAPEILYAARTAGVDRIFALGGAQAVAAMAYGTETVARVDKIFGPGNRYVTKAKQLVSVVTAIDMPAGPSEVMVMADHSASPAFVAADMLSQAEHGPDSQAMVVCDSESLSTGIIAEVERQAALLPRRSLVEASLSRSRIVVLDRRDEMIEFANLYAAEHLIISMENPWEIAGAITAAGSVFIGNMSPESAGDYASGTNHTLPTGGWARSMSGVNTDSFMRRITYQELTDDGLASLAPVIITMAEAEGLDAHAAAVKVRLEGKPSCPSSVDAAKDITSGNVNRLRDPLKYVRPNILALSPYSTARDEFKGGDIDVWVDANENPYPNGLNRYPDPRHRALKEAIGRLKGVAADTVFIGGAGSDEAIDLVYRVFCRPGVDNVVAMSPTYGVYAVAAAINDVEYREVPPGEDFALPVEDMLAAADNHTKVIWVCSPNNPTGNAVPTETIASLARRFDGIVVVDEAYVDFSPYGSILPMLPALPNVIVLQTFSKAWGMAGLRVGMAFASPAIAAIFANVKYPYNINGPTQSELMRRMRRDISDQVAEIISERGRLATALGEMECVRRVYRSDANFLLVKVDDADALYGFLVSRGILVRNRNRVAHCSGTLRFTVGTPAENRRVITAMKEYMGHIPAGDPSGNGRVGDVDRRTSETDIHVHVDLDGDGSSSHIDTGLKFFDHMLSQLPHHGGFNLDVTCHGDLEVDEHHTMEDVAIALGEAMLKALGDKRGIERYGFVLPMDESRAMVLVDLGGRADFRWDVEFSREYVGDTPTEMFSHFFSSLASALKANIHVSARGDNNHHLAEGIFKAFARAMRMAVRRERFSYSLPSSKGIL